MAFSQHHLFKSKIDNKNIVDIVDKLDYTISSFEERMGLIRTLLGEEFFNGYFSDFFKSNISTNDYLSEKNNVCQALLKITDYILGCEEITEKFKEKKVVYKFYQNEEMLNNAINKEQSLEYIQEQMAMDEEVIHFLMKRQNHKKSKNISVLPKDIERDDYTGEVLRDYNVLKQCLLELKDNKELREEIGYIYSRGKISYMIKELNADMLVVKKQLDGINGQALRHPGDEGQVIEWSCLDYTNYNHIRALLYSNATQLSADNEISFLVYDLETMIRKMVSNKKLNVRDLTIIKMIREGYLQEEIAADLSITQERVSMKILQISKKIAKEFSLKK